MKNFCPTCGQTVGNSKLGDEDFINNLKQLDAYKAIDIDQELDKMRAWLMAHPGRRLTKRFIEKWLKRTLETKEEVKIPKVNQKAVDCWVKIKTLASKGIHLNKVEFKSESKSVIVECVRACGGMLNIGKANDYQLKTLQNKFISKFIEIKNKNN